MNKITFHVAIFLCVTPLMAQNQVTVTSADDSGGPGTYVPLVSNTAILNAPIFKNANTPAQMQTSMLDQSAAVHDTTVHGLPPGIGATALPDLSGVSQSITQTAAPTNTPATTTATSSAASYTPPPFNSLANSVSFIQHQLANSIGGLPQTFYEPSGATTGQQVNDIGIGTYDTSLALIALIQSGNLIQAQNILNIYKGGSYGPPPSSSIFPPAAEVLTAFPTGDNGGAFGPFNSNTYYYFDDADANAKYEPSWNQYGSHTGPNAWLALAICQYIQAERKAGVSDNTLTPYLMMAARIGNSMILLQNDQTSGLNDQTQGAVRYGPHQSFEDPYETVNTENNVDAYSAFNSISQVMQQSTLSSFSSTASTYLTASGKIIDWLGKGSFYNPNTGQTQTGMRDSQSGLLFMGADFDAKNKRWVLETQLAEDSGGSWTISALGVPKIDSIWGKGAALQMGESILKNFGRTETGGNPATIHDAGPSDPIIGLDYSDGFASNQALISPEWTAGGINALQQLISYYRSNPLSSPRDDSRSRGGVTHSPLAVMSADVKSMQGFLAQGQDAYAIGPGLTGARQGETGFGWQAPTNTSIAAMASIYGTLQDPLAAWRPALTPSPSR